MQKASEQEERYPIMVSSTSGSSPRHARPSFTQVAASALAAVSAAVISSTFGVAGTLIGAAIASVVASVGSTLYLASLRTTNERLRRLAVAARRTDWPGGVPAQAPAPETSAAVHEPELPFPSALDEPARQPPSSEAIEVENPPGWNRLRWTNLRRGLPALRRRWVAVAGLAVLVFAITVGVLTAVGASTKQSAFPLGGNSGSGKSPTAPVSSPAKATTSPTPAPSASASSTASPTAAATPSASASAGSSASPGAGAPSAAPSPSASPSGGANVSPSPTSATVP